MVSLTTQKQLRNVRDLHFCYLCGVSFNAGDEANYDHVPPEKIFVEQDRNFPLKLKTHQNPCHSNLNLDDEIIGQLISLIHGKQPSKRNDKIKIKVGLTDTGKNLAVYEGRNLEELIKRWLRGFHVALYRSVLPVGTYYAIQTPFPSCLRVNGQLVEDSILEQHYVFVESIKKNRSVNNLDVIVSNNGKLKYECVWDQLDDKSWFCMFALNLYDWKNLGDVNNFQPRGCAGSYRLPSGEAPAGAAISTQLKFMVENIDKADPFSK